MTVLCAPDPRGRIDRLWSQLGFGTCRARLSDEQMLEEGYVPGNMGSTVVFVLDWKDRIRALVSGKLMLDIATQTDVMPRRLRSFSAVSVLPPNAKVDR